MSPSDIIWIPGDYTLTQSHLSALPTPRVLLFDWHGTLVDTGDAMYQAIEDMLSRLDELQLADRLTSEQYAKTSEDEKLVRYIRIFRHLHPKILSERRVSRTDIFDALFATDSVAMDIAHRAYNDAYRDHYGKVKPFQLGVKGYLQALKGAGLKLGVTTNRSREFLSNEILTVDEGAWATLFDASVCGDEAAQYKPEPDSIFQTLERMGEVAGTDVWYVGDSVTDMVTASRAGVTSIFYNGALWQKDWIEHMFSDEDRALHRPNRVVDDFDQLLDLIETVEKEKSIKTGDSLPQTIKQTRPARQPSRQPSPPRQEPDWHPAVAELEAPHVILFDWHATLVDTLDAMYHAVDDMLPELSDMGLVEHLVDAADCKSPEDIKLVEYVRSYGKLHPKIKVDRKISRTDIFEVLFGDNEEAKVIAHTGFTKHYRNHFGTALPFEPKVKNVLMALRELELQVGVITNRDREFFVHELGAVEGTGWTELFDTDICGDDTRRRKPHPDQIYKAVENLGGVVSPNVWYVGDSTTDTIAAKVAGITSVFFNGAQWDQPWLNKIFPGSERYPHKPDVVVNDFSEFWALVLACRKRALKP